MRLKAVRTEAHLVARFLGNALLNSAGTLLLKGKDYLGERTDLTLEFGDVAPNLGRRLTEGIHIAFHFVLGDAANQVVHHCVDVRHYVRSFKKSLVWPVWLTLPRKAI